MCGVDRSDTKCKDTLAWSGSRGVGSESSNSSGRLLYTTGSDTSVVDGRGALKVERVERRLALRPALTESTVEQDTQSSE